MQFYPKMKLRSCNIPIQRIYNFHQVANGEYLWKCVLSWNVKEPYGGVIKSCTYVQSRVVCCSGKCENEEERIHAIRPIWQLQFILRH